MPLVLYDQEFLARSPHILSVTVLATCEVAFEFISSLSANNSFSLLPDTGSHAQGVENLVRTWRIEWFSFISEENILLITY